MPQPSAMCWHGEGEGQGVRAGDHVRLSAAGDHVRLSATAGQTPLSP